MNQPLLNSEDVIEFTMSNLKSDGDPPISSSMIEPNAIAKFQLLDIAEDFEPLFKQKNVSKGFYPQRIENFKPQNPAITKFQNFLRKIPVFMPESPKLLVYQTMMTLIIFFYFFYTPFKIFFWNTDHQHIPSNRDDNLISGITLLTQVTLGVLYFDILVSLNTAFHQNGVIQKSRIKIFIHYSKGVNKKLFIFSQAFQLDLIGVISLSVALTANLDWVRLFFYLRFYYVLRYDAKIEKIIQLKKSIRKTQILQLETKAFYSLLKLILTVLFVVHIMACLFYGVGIITINKESDYDPSIDVLDDSWLLNSSFTTEDYPEVIKRDIFGRYILSIYWAITTISTVGYGDITPKNLLEVLIAIITMSKYIIRIYNLQQVIAGMVFAFNVSSIRETLQYLNESDKQFESQLSCINNYMNIKNITEATQIRVQEYLKYLWKEEHNRNHDQETTLINQLPPDLKEQLLQETYLPFFQSTAFYFQEYSPSLLRSLSANIQESYVGLNEDIVDEELHLYFILQGSVLLVILFYKIQNQYIPCQWRRFDDNIRVEVRGISQCFGEISFFTGEKNELLARSLSYTRLYKLKRSIFLSKISGSEQDFEQFHILLVNRYRGKFLKMLGLRCQTCNEENHLTQMCPVTHFVPDRVDIRLKQNPRKEQIQLRKKFSRQQLYYISKNVWKSAQKLKEQAQQVVYHMNQRDKRKLYDLQKSRLSGNFSRLSANYSHLQINMDIEQEQQLGHTDEYSNEHDQLIQEIQNLKQMIDFLTVKLGFKQEVEIPIHKDQEFDVFKPASNFYLQITYNYKEPLFEPLEICFDIDVIKNYQYFQPEFNITQINLP